MALRTFTRLAQLGAAAAVAVSAPAFAGGDLESDTRSQLQAVSERLAQLEATKADKDKVVTKGYDTVWLKLSGHVNRAVMLGVNDDTAQFFFVDSDASETRARLNAGASLGGDWTIGSEIELGINTNQSSAVVFAGDKPLQSIGDNRNEKPNFRIRKAQVDIAHPGYGRLTLGHGNMSSFLTASMDLSGTDVIAFSNTGVTGGSLNTDRGTTIGALTTDFNGAARKDRLRYDTPSMGGLVLTSSVAERDLFDVAAFYSRNFDGLRVAAAGGYVHDHLKGDIVSTSASVLFPFGISLTGSYSQMLSGEHPRNYYAKVGYQTADFCSYGRTAISVDASLVENFLATALHNGDNKGDGNQSISYGLTGVQFYDNYATELYASWRYFQLDPKGAPEEDDIHVGIVGARLKF